MVQSRNLSQGLKFSMFKIYSSSWSLINKLICPVLTFSRLGCLVLKVVVDLYFCLGGLRIMASLLSCKLFYPSTLSL